MFAGFGGKVLILVEDENAKFNLNALVWAQWRNK